MTNSYKCIILDDNEIDRLAVLSYVRKYPFLSIEAMYASPNQLLEEIDEIQPDVLFLDIDMPQMNGLDLRNKLLHIPACIFITSYPDFAIEGFEVAALDYMLKPIKATRFEQSMSRLKVYLDIHKNLQAATYVEEEESIFLKEGHEKIKVLIKDIQYVEAFKDYTCVVTKNKKHFILQSIGHLLNSASFAEFTRIHRSYGVRMASVSKISHDVVYIGNIQIPIGRAYKHNVIL